MEAPEEMGVATKEQDDFAHEDPKWRRGVAAPQGPLWISRNPTASKWRVFRGPPDWDGLRVRI